VTSTIARLAPTPPFLGRIIQSQSSSPLRQVLDRAPNVGELSAAIETGWADLGR
jgi:hypothetical protein